MQLRVPLWLSRQSDSLVRNRPGVQIPPAALNFLEDMVDKGVSFIVVSLPHFYLLTIMVSCVVGCCCFNSVSPH